MDLQTVDYLKWAPARIVNAADRLVSFKKNKDPWETIEEVVKIWKDTHPTDYDSFLYDLDTKKDISKVTNIGSKQFRGVSIDESGATIRHRLGIPVKVVYMIRKLYPEMNMDKEFYEEWGKRFPSMVIESVV